MMNSLFDGPFGLMGQNAITNDAHRCRNHQDDLQIMPFGFPPMPSFNMGRLFADFVSKFINSLLYKILKLYK